MLAPYRVGAVLPPVAEAWLRLLKAGAWLQHSKGPQSAEISANLHPLIPPWPLW